MPAILARRGGPVKGPSNVVDCFAVMRLVRRSGLSYAAQALLMAVLDHDRYGRSKAGCTASMETLAEEIGATARYVAKLLPQLLEDGWLIAEPQRGRVRPLRMGTACTTDHRTIGQECEAAPMNDRACTYERSDQDPCPIGQTKRFPRIHEEMGFPPPPKPEEISPAFAKFFGRLLPPGVPSPGADGPAPPPRVGPGGVQ